MVHSTVLGVGESAAEGARNACVDVFFEAAVVTFKYSMWALHNMDDGYSSVVDGMSKRTALTCGLPLPVAATPSFANDTSENLLESAAAVYIASFSNQAQEHPLYPSSQSHDACLVVLSFIIHVPWPLHAGLPGHVFATVEEPFLTPGGARRSFGLAEEDTINQSPAVFNWNDCSPKPPNVPMVPTVVVVASNVAT